MCWFFCLGARLVDTIIWKHALTLVILFLSSLLGHAVHVLGPGTSRPSLVLRTNSLGLPFRIVAAITVAATLVAWGIKCCFGHPHSSSIIKPGDVAPVISCHDSTSLSPSAQVKDLGRLWRIRRLCIHLVTWDSCWTPVLLRRTCQCMMVSNVNLCLWVYERGNLIPGQQRFDTESFQIISWLFRFTSQSQVFKKLSL